MSDLSGRAAIVTGASRGIGLAIAADLVQHGAKVCVTARKPEALEAAVEQLGADNAIAVAGNAGDPSHPAEVVAKTVEAFGGVHMLVNNAGINPVYGSILDVEPDMAGKIFGTNVVAPLAFTKACRDAWMGEHGGSVVNIASIAGARTSPGIGMYGVTKAALMRLTMELADELGPDIRVNAVAPGVVKTKFAAALYEGKEDEVAEPYPLKRLGVPEDIAGAVRFLLSVESAWITGQTLLVDGGITVSGVVG